MNNTVIRQDTISKTFGFLVKNSFAFTVGVIGLVHVGLLIFMAYTGVLPLMYFNILRYG